MAEMQTKNWKIDIMYFWKRRLDKISVLYKLVSKFDALLLKFS